MWYDIEGIVQIVLTGAFTGVGSAIGSYFALNYGIHKMEKMLRGGKAWRSSSSRSRTRK